MFQLGSDSTESQRNEVTSCVFVKYLCPANGSLTGKNLVVAVISWWHFQFVYTESGEEGCVPLFSKMM